MTAPNLAHPDVKPTATRQQMSARIFYGLILAGVLSGVLVCSLGGYLYLSDAAHLKPTGRRIWEASAEQFVVPICVMIGGTFGGMAGVAAAVLCQIHLGAKR